MDGIRNNPPAAAESVPPVALPVSQGFRTQARGLIRTMRPRQWTKNAFVFAALLFDRKITHPTFLLVTVAAFILLCMLSSAVYIINDLVDIDKDRRHPTKRYRPLASGALSPRVALFAGALLPAIAIPFSFVLSTGLGVVMSAYLAMNLAYSFWLKNIVIIDVLTLAAGFVLRVAAGVTLFSVERFSPWLYVCTTLLALFIGFGKRRQELVMLKDAANSTRKILNEYTLQLLDEMMSVVTATTVLAYSIYTFTAQGLPDDHSMMLTIPFVLYGIFRYLYLIHVRGEGGAPDEVILKDRPLQLTVFLWGAAVFAILYVFHPAVSQ